MKFYSPLRYPGGKGKLSDLVEGILDTNHLYDCDYAEPFAGGAGIALNLLLTEKIGRIFINDLSTEIYNFWWAILNRTEEFIKLILSEPLNVENWKFHKQRIFSTKDPFHIGFSFFYLNRTTRSGLATGGPIGGYNQTGTWKIDARFNRDELSERVNRISKKRNRIVISNLDAIDFVKDVTGLASKNLLIYFDPPYFHNSKRLYFNTYNSDDHSKVSNFVRKDLKSRWMMTYDNCKEIKKLYSGCKIFDLELQYNAARVYKGSELLIFSDNLIVPDIFSSRNTQRDCLAV
jgi:DNA adenine methylase